MPYSWITPVTDRNYYTDVLTAQTEIDKKKADVTYQLGLLKGCLNYTDLNRIENNLQVLAEMIPVSISQSVLWTSSSIPVYSEHQRIIGSASTIRSAFLLEYPEMASVTETVPVYLQGYQEFNQLESLQLRIYEKILSETMISVILLDENLEETDDVHYFSNANDVNGFISGSGSEKYTVRFGSRTGITSLGNEAFKNVTKLVNIILPASVISIGRDAFNGCSNLKKVEINGNLTSISMYTFKNCINLETFNLPSTVTNIDAYAFYGCSSLSGITFPSSIQSIGVGSFANSGLKRISLNAISVSIGNNAFSGSDLTEIYLSGVDSIGEGVFGDCTDLISVDYDGAEVGRAMFSGCSLLSNVLIGENATKIGISAFSNCDSILSFDISYATVIMNDAFKECTNLATVTIGSQIQTIANRAFYRCNALTSISIDLATDSIAGKPWGATNATVNWN